MNDEIKDESFTGPKQYALKLQDKITKSISFIQKIRGITLDDDARQHLTYEAMVKAIRGPYDEPSVVMEKSNSLKDDDSSGDDGGRKLKTKRFNLKRKTNGIQTVIEKKRYIARNRKGVLNATTERVLPYGYDAGPSNR